ncbi:MAG: TetR/AcrR family transcriptional regulator [Candidatus Solibacter sp.]|nr:TetR/AcrR family transcriptional regulator [Candidatus Solibacter sp.]
MTNTKQKILDTAERLIGERGYAATSLRHIIAEAGVNLAAVHYHFGSKEDLLDAVVVRKAAPVNAARLARLDRIEAEAGSGRPDVEKVLESFLIPTAEMANRNPEFVRLMGRMHAEGLMPLIVGKHFQAMVLRFVAALRRALPGLPEEELMWRVHFMMGAMSQTMCSAPIFARMAGNPADMEPRMRRLVTFLGAGFRASATAGKEKK